MRKQRLLKNLNCRGKALAILLTVTASLLYSVSALATDWAATYYFDNTSTKWDNVYLIIGKSTWVETIEMTADDDCAGIYKHALTGWTDATAFFFASTRCGFEEGSKSGDINKDLSSYSNYTAKITSKPSNFVFVPSTTGSGITGNWVRFNRCDLNDVLSGDKIMCYGGEAKDWNQSTYMLMNTNATSDVAASGTMSGEYDIEVDDSEVQFEFAPLAVATGTYYHGHWASGLQGAVAAGESFIVYTKEKDIDGYSVVQAGSSNSLYKKAAGTTTVTFTAGASITQGSNYSITGVSAAGSSSIGVANTIKWYITEQGEDDYTEYTLSEGSLNTSSLAIGDYTLKAVLTDGNIYVVGGTKDFEVTAAGDAPTVLLAAEPTVSEAKATLHGYLKYTGCQNVTDFGFIWSETEADIAAATPTGTKVAATSPEAPITVGNYGTEFTLADGTFTASTTIYYKAYAKNSVGTGYSAMGQFTTQACTKPVVSSISVPEKICSNVGTITATATAIEGATYAWTVDGSVFSQASGTTYQAIITVATSGTGSISVTPTKDGCVGDAFPLNNIAVSAAATAFTVSGDGIVCAGSTANVTLSGSQTGYTYELYREGSTTSTTMAGTGNALSFTVSEAGTYTVKGYLTDFAGCSTDMSGSATLTAGGVTVTMSPATAHPYEVTTFTASGSATWSIQTRPDGVTEAEAYLSGTSGASVTFKGKAATGYTVRAATTDGCNTDTSFDVVADPELCNN